MLQVTRHGYYLYKLQTQGRSIAQSIQRTSAGQYFNILEIS